MAYVFTDDEIKEVASRFPNLFWKPLIGLWEGRIDFFAQYKSIAIEDSYEIEIMIPENYPRDIPVLRVKQERLIGIMKRHKILDLRELHYSKTNACLCVKQEEKSLFPIGSSLSFFIENLVIPYLYGLSCYDKYGKWPWTTYSHGCLGLLEYYSLRTNNSSKQEIEEIASLFRKDIGWKEYCRQIRKPSPDRNCVCGSHKPFQKCHKNAWEGVLQLRLHLENLKLNPRKLFQRN